MPPPKPRCHGFLLGLCLSLLLPGQLSLVAGCSREGDENLGLVKVEKQKLPDLKKIDQPQVLSQVAAQPLIEYRQLAPLRLSVNTTWKIRPPPPLSDLHEVAPVEMEEEGLVELDGKNGMHILHNNDHGYGTEALVLGDSLFIRMRYGPYVKRNAEAEEVNRLLAASADGGAALLAALQAYIDITEVSQVSAFGRPALKLVLTGRKEAQRSLLPKGNLPPTKMWLRAVSVESLSGVAVVDRSTSLLLGLRLQTVFAAPRGPLEGPGAAATTRRPKVIVDVTHRSAVSGLGEQLTLSAPQDAIAPPVRPRPMLDHRELLDGLAGTPRLPAH